MHRGQHLAAMLRPDHLGHQHRAGGPFAPEADALNGLEDQQLRIALREGAGEGGESKPQNGNLQSFDPPVAIRQRASDPPAEGASKQRDGSQ